MFSLCVLSLDSLSWIGEVIAALVRQIVKLRVTRGAVKEVHDSQHGPIPSAARALCLLFLRAAMPGNSSIRGRNGILDFEPASLDSLAAEDG
jgi:hypothetical protein